MSNNVKIVINNISRVVKVKKKNKTILNNVNISINKGELVAIVGCSGAGKTTFMNILSGYNKPTTGTIIIDGLDLYKEEEYLKGKIAYVPQKEILDQTLSLYKSLQYSLKLRVKYISKKSSKILIDSILQTLELHDVKDVLIKDLSGGEKKRAAIATEMLSNPSLFLLDEPTSGLDANIEKKLMRELKNISNLGKTIIMTAHTVSNLELCDKIIFMGKDGKICYYGPYEDVFAYFNVTQFVDIYDILKDDTDTWYNKFKREHRRKLKNPFKEKDKSKNPKVSFIKQTLILVKRYMASLYNNKFMLILLLGQSILMGLVICVAVEKESFLNPEFATMIAISFSMASIWIGLFNTVQEVVKERDILKKEYISGLRFSSYITSKLIIFSLLCFWEALTCVSIVYFYLDPRPNDILIFNTWFDLVINFFLVTFTSSIIGLFISSLAKDTKTTLIVAPLYMMIHILFSGVFIPFVDFTKKVSYIVTGRWAYESFGTILKLPQYNVLEAFNKQFEFTKIHLLSIWDIYLIMILLFFITTIFIIKRNIVGRD